MDRKQQTALAERERMVAAIMEVLEKYQGWKKSINTSDVGQEILASLWKAGFNVVRHRRYNDG